MTSNERYREGGWGWFVVLACFTAEFIVYGTLKALGVLITAMKEDLDTDLWIMGSITALHIGVHFTLSPVTTILARRYGGRPVIIVGGVLYGLGLVVASTTYSVVIIAIALIGPAVRLSREKMWMKRLRTIQPHGLNIQEGAGLACVRQTARGEIAFYFHDRFSVALFIGLTGSSVGVIVYGPLTQVFLDAYGWRGAMLLLGGLGLNLLVAGALVRRPKHERGPTRRENLPVSGDNAPHKAPAASKPWMESLGLNIVTNVEFILLAGMRMSYNVSYNGFMVYMVPNALESGLSPTQASSLTASFGAGSLAGLFLGAVLARHQRLVHGAIVSASLLTALLLAVDPLIHSFAGQQVVIAVIGVGIYCITMVVAVLSRNLPFGDESVGLIYGWMAFFSGVASSIGDVFLGWIYETSRSFFFAFLLISGSMVAVALCATVDFVRLRNKRKTNSLTQAEQ